MDRRTKATINRDKALRLNEEWGVGASQGRSRQRHIGQPLDGLGGSSRAWRTAVAFGARERGARQERIGRQGDRREGVRAHGARDPARARAHRAMRAARRRSRCLMSSPTCRAHVPEAAVRGHS